MSYLSQYVRRPALMAVVFVLISTSLNLLFHKVPWGAEVDGYFYFIGNGPLIGREYGWSWLHPPLFLIAGKIFYAIVGDAFRAGQLVSIISAGFLILLGGLLAGLLSSSREAATVAALFLAFNDGVLNQSMLCSTDMLFSTIALAGFVGLFLTLSKSKPRHAALTGALFGMAYMTRYQGIVFLVTIPLLLLTVKGSMRFRLSLILCFAMGALVVILPLMFYEHLVLGKPLKVAAGLYIYRDQPDIIMRTKSADDFFLQLRNFVSNACKAYPYALFYFFRLSAFLPLIIAIGGTFFMWRTKRFTKLQLQAVTLLGLIGVLYFMEVGWMIPQDFAYQSHWRFLLPILPLVFVVSAYFIESINNRWTKHLIKIACIGFLIYFNVTTNFASFKFETPPQKLFAERLKSEVEVENLLIVGNPVDFYLYFNKFAFLEVEQCIDASGILSIPQSKNPVKYDLLILPEPLLKDIQRQPDKGAWLTNIHELLFCSYGYCALKPKHFES